ncbi:MAG: hypothetical protein R3313_05020 [Candidatus Saccharimonadales bacterium]|uniref:hypothetical protein n=1 Tax=Vreelandella venusta TaxID=44935 RepID=UPI0029B3CD10|nr:hypothetical protein [Candidatus Saccharimonadales bacterium]
MPSKRTRLVETIKSEQTQELLANGADALIDTLSDSDIVGNIPFVGTVLKTYQAAQGIRERMLVKKLANFLKYPSQMTEEEKLKFSTEFEDPSKEEEFGEQMLMLIEQSEDTEKPKIIGRLLVAHVKGHFDRPTFMRLCKMIDRAYVEDFTYLARMGKNNNRYDGDVEQSLFSAGFLRMDTSNVGINVGGITINGDTRYVRTNYGTWVVRLGITKGSIPAPTPKLRDTLFKFS